jgi:hypothetical protein
MVPKRTKWLDNQTLWNDDSNLIINYEFERLLLSYADVIKIIKPKKLEKKIQGRLKTALSFY